VAFVLPRSHSVLLWAVSDGVVVLAAPVSFVVWRQAKAESRTEAVVRRYRGATASFAFLAVIFTGELVRAVTR